MIVFYVILTAMSNLAEIGQFRLFEVTGCCRTMDAAIYEERAE